MKFFSEPAKEIPVFGEYDVVVAGGGPAGIGAAIAAARTGAKTIVIEQMGCLGGISTAGLHPQMQVIQYEEGNVSSIPVEIGIRAEKLDIGLRGYRYGKGCFQYEIEAFKRLLDDMVLEVGCEILYQTLVSDTIVENDVVKGVIIQNKTGRSAVLAKRVVDCTADADVAARGGVEFEQGREQDGLVQPCTLMFRVDGVDVSAVESPENSGKIRLKDGMVKMDKSVWQYAIDNGEMDPFQTKVMGFWVTHKRPTQISVNFTNLTGIDEFTIADAPPLEDIFHHFMSFCGDPEENVLVAHNSPFDLSFLKAAAFNLEIDWPDYRVLDTVRMARSVLTQDDLPNVKLGTLAEFFEVEIMPTHRALADVQATVEILHALIDRVGSHGVSSINSLEDFLLTKKKGRSFYS